LERKEQAGDEGERVFLHKDQFGLTIRIFNRN